MKFIVLLFLAISINAERIANWEGHSIEREDDGKLLKLIHKKSKKVSLQQEFPLGFKHGFYKLGKEKLLYITYFSGGENGCCYYTNFYYGEKDGIQSFSLSGIMGESSQLKIVDIDGDGHEEIKSTSNKFYDLKMEEKGAVCSITPAETVGQTKFEFPQFLAIAKNEAGEYIVQDYSFEEKHKKEVNLAFLKIEAYLKHHTDKVFKNNNLDLIGVFQYFYYKKNSESLDAALNYFKSHNHSIEYSCVASGKTQTVKTSFYEFVKSYPKLFE
ncbi:MAG: hypothetical protein SFU98_05505 [Leptospiraceae bacterium]|nr:hypothetical protein [Leptospiraceae bacterium]